ncbi:cyclic peptide export ABC transporter [Thalassomonas viridans]|uniref:Cyclic peptide export ABC transporter n=1 Tax=Thalassomonas viridans TaxID=137584 RepID=A0AAE9Z9G3_9GAMM|nr:cyclic peptide export ABC transporter [Thalassomonas viridans]WDE09221.1 cyclic peptide export ABC transporter [Thalassomonas viridans]
MRNKKSSIVSLLFNFSPKLLFISVVIGALSGALYSLIIPLAISGIEATETRPDSASALNFLNADMFSGNQGMLFFTMVGFILFTKALSVILVNNIAKSATAELKVKIVKKINTMKLDDVENLGFSRLLNILTDDVNRVAGAATAIPMVVVSTVTIIGMLGYLAFLNVIVFFVVLAAIFFGIFLFQIPVGMVQGLYQQARKLKDTIQEGIQGLVYGAFELKLDERKSKNYIKEEIIEPQEKSVKLEKIGDAIIHLAGTSSDLLSFFIIGGIVFILPAYIELPVANSFGIVMALLYIAGPVAGILGMLQQMEMGKVALKRIHELEDCEEEKYPETSTSITQWSKYSVQGISYQYDKKGLDSPFSLKPVSLSFERGQINFIVGGNGSGKSTLSKLLSLHYRSFSGKIFFDNIRLTDENICFAREKISVIYSDYFLFRKLYRQHSEADEMKVNAYLHALGLAGKTEFVDGYFTTTDLSDGQRRRLALLVALIEDKDIYIFDEWAADQDPVFKSVFYQKILPDMKKDNKLVIVITHDDRYFDCADRVIFMEDGALVDVKQVQPSKTTVHALSQREGDFILDDVTAT